MTAHIVQSDSRCLPLPDNSVDLSHDYGRVARWRTTDPGQRARVLQVDKPVEQIAGQGELFGDVA